MTGRLTAYFHEDGYQALKVMLDADDDPFTTPNNAYHKFAFNSETSLIGYTYDIRTINWAGSGVVPRTLALTSLGDHQYAYAFNSSATNRQMETHTLDGRAIIGGAFLPLIEAKIRVKAGTHTGRFYNHFVYRYNDGPRGINGSFWYTDRIACQQASWGAITEFGTVPHQGGGSKIVQFAHNADTIHVRPWYVEGGQQGGLGTNPPPGWLDTVDAAESVVLIWDLPADDTPLTPPIGPGGPGTKRLVLTPTIAKMSRPGYDVATATGRQLIFDSTRIPTKIIGSGEFFFANNATFDVMVPEVFRPLSPYTFVDTIVQVGSFGWTHPGATSPLGTFNEDRGASLHYLPMTDRIRFFNVSGYTLGVRYVIFAEDRNPPTSGPDGPLKVAEDAIQILRPGSGNPPNFKDIILDSRMHYLPIVAEGYIPRSSFISTDNAAYGTRRAVLEFENTGFRPFLKYTCHYRVNFGGSLVFDMWNQPMVNRIANTPAISDGLSAWSNIALIENDRITFYASYDRPSRAWWSGNSAGTGVQSNTSSFASDQGLRGIRYYVFGIPTDL